MRLRSLLFACLVIPMSDPLNAAAAEEPIRIGVPMILSGAGAQFGEPIFSSHTSRTLTTAPRLLLLDEPSEGLAPVIVDALVDSISALRDAGLTIILAEQSLSVCLALADEVAVVEKGSLRYMAERASFARDADLLQELLTV